MEMGNVKQVFATCMFIYAPLIVKLSSVENGFMHAYKEVGRM